MERALVIKMNEKEYVLRAAQGGGLPQYAIPPACLKGS
jgi:hypothetical protein